MAKVRIQARSADAEEALELNESAPASHGSHHKHGKHLGALEILFRVWKREGFTGWYQVSRSFVNSCKRSINSFIQGMSCSIAGITFHVKRAVRTLSARYRDLRCSAFKSAVNFSRNLYTF